MNLGTGMTVAFAQLHASGGGATTGIKFNFRLEELKID